VEERQSAANQPSYPIRNHHRQGPLKSTLLLVGTTTATAAIASAATRRWQPRASDPAADRSIGGEAPESLVGGEARVPLRNLAERFLCGACASPIASMISGLFAAAATVAWLRRPAGGKRRPLLLAVVDTETTGLDAAIERVIEVAVVHADGLGRLTDRFSWRVRPDDGRHGAEHVHHISQADLADEPTFGEVAESIADALRGRVVVAHNAPFDTRFLLSEYDRSGRAAPAALLRPLCTVDLASRLGMSPLRLSEVARALGTPQPATAHRALDDAVATAQLLKPLLNRAGIATVEELPLVDGAKRRPAPRRRVPLRQQVRQLLPNR
jgi:DNA polymerase III epsilon subunit-like protein